MAKKEDSGFLGFLAGIGSAITLAYVVVGGHREGLLQTAQGRPQEPYDPYGDYVPGYGPGYAPDPYQNAGYGYPGVQQAGWSDYVPPEAMNLWREGQHYYRGLKDLGRYQYEQLRHWQYGLPPNQPTIPWNMTPDQYYQNLDTFRRHGLPPGYINIPPTWPPRRPVAA